MVAGKSTRDKTDKLCGVQCDVKLNVNLIVSVNVMRLDVMS